MDERDAPARLASERGHGGAPSRVDDELHVRIEHAREDAALEIIGCVLQQSGGNGRVKLHLGWSGAFPGRSVLERIVCEASRQAARLRQEIAFELTLDAQEVTAAVADALASLALQVRLLCGSYPARMLTPGEMTGLLPPQSIVTEIPSRKTGTG